MDYYGMFTFVLTIVSVVFLQFDFLGVKMRETAEALSHHASLLLLLSSTPAQGKWFHFQRQLSEADFFSCQLFKIPKEFPK